MLLLLLRFVLPFILILLAGVVLLRFLRNRFGSGTGRTAGYKINNSVPIDNHSPSQVAAVAMMTAIAGDTGDVTERERKKIFEYIHTKFNMIGKQAEDIYAKGLNLSSKTDDMHLLFNRFSPVINENCSHLEKKQLFEMLREVAAAETGEPTQSQKEALSALTGYLEIGFQNMSAPPL